MHRCSIELNWIVKNLKCIHYEESTQSQSITNSNLELELIKAEMKIKDQDQLIMHLKNNCKQNSNII